MYKTQKSQYQQDIDTLKARLEEVNLALETGAIQFLINQKQSIELQIQALESNHNDE